MKYIASIIISILVFVLSDGSKTDINNCLPSNQINLEILEDFLEKSEWLTERMETGTNSLSVNDIELVQTNTNACTQLKAKYSKGIDEIDNEGIKTYNSTLYKVDNFYFLIATLNQTNDPQVVVAGLSHIYVTDLQFNQLGGWTF